MKAKVSLVKCGSYDQNAVDAAVRQSLEFFGGMDRFVKPGRKVLIKPNALMGENPDAAVTTHPSIISAVVKEVVSAGAIALVGDSPGNAYANVAGAMERSGMRAATEEAGGRLVYFQQEGVVETKKIPLAKPVMSADVVINLPKLKTHNLTAYTGAIKNMFGAVPGFHKAHFHIRFPDPRDFAAALVDVFEIARPALNIMDAVIGMEGPGPSAGNPRKMGAIIASTDAVAMDAVGAYLIGYQPSQIDTTAEAHKRGLGEMRLEKIEILGARLEELRQTDWKRALNLYSFVQKHLPALFYPLLSPLLNQLKIWPIIMQEKCTRCLVCVKNCPAKTINYYPKNKKVEIDLKNCIACFCCHELCEYKAVRLRRNWLAKIAGI